MKIALIVAMDENRVIGNENQLPWHLPADLKHFKNITMGKPMIMGRKTFESIGKALPGRRNIVITRNKNFSAKDIDVVYSLDEALQLVQDSDEVMIIGGAAIFELALPKANRLYLTTIHESFPGDTFFPKINLENWQEISRQNFADDDANPHAYSFITFEQKKTPKIN